MGPKKHLGQHFLTAPAIAKKIAEAVPARDGESVLEIGPGRGALSVHLIERWARLHLVEVDADAVRILREKLGGRGNVIHYKDTGGRASSNSAARAGNTNGQADPDCTIRGEDANGQIPPGSGGCTIHNGDVMAFDFSLAGFPVHAVGNLPYNIGAMIIKKTLMYSPSVASCTFMVQREVAERIVSGPHSRQNGFLSVFCQFFGPAKLLFHVPPGAFFPRPNVDSSVFQIIVDPDVEKKLERGQWEDFFSFADAGFSMRRKQLAKTLAMKFGRGKEHFCGILSEMGMGASARPEDLDAANWLILYKRAGLR